MPREMPSDAQWEPPYIVRAAEIAGMEGLTKTHFLNPNARRLNKSLGDATGLTGLGFHIIEVEPGCETTEHHVHHHEDEAALLSWLAARDVTLIGVDNLPGSVALETAELPERSCLVFGSEGPGLTDAMVAGCDFVVAITQHGSTRSMNAGAAAAIAMYHWSLQHRQATPRVG